MLAAYGLGGEAPAARPIVLETINPACWFAFFESYVRETASTSPVDELHKLADLKDRGAISDAEYEKMKAKLVG